MRKLLFIPFAALLAIAFPGAADAQNPRYGIVTSVFDENHAVYTSELGTGSVRIGIPWFMVEPQQDQFDWGNADRWINEATNRGLEILAGMGYTPQWAGPAWTGECVDGHCMPYNINDWYDFVYQVINRYRGYSNITFEVWNEPNQEFLNDDGVATQYALLFEYADRARDAANSSARLSGPETSHHAYFDGYLNSALSKIGPYLAPQDVVTVHWYDDGPNLFTYMSDVISGASGHDVWLTETGKATCDDTVQSNWVRDLMWNFDAWGLTRWTRTFLYVLQDGGSCTETIMRPNWTKREAFTWYRNYVGQQSRTSRPVSFQSVNGYYVVAEGNGGDVVNANRPAIGAWETFSAVDQNGASLRSGDFIWIQTGSNLFFLAENGGGARMLATGLSGGEWERFQIIRLAGPGVINHGDAVALRLGAFGPYTVAEGGGGREVNVNRPAIESWETFTIIFH